MKSIKTKLIGSFSMLVFIVMITLGSISLGVGYYSLKKEAENSLVHLADEGAKLTQSRMESMIITLGIIAKKQSILNMGWEINLDEIKQELVKTDFIDIGYVMKNGYTHYTDGTVRLMSDRDYIKNALEGKTAISDVIISRVTRKPEIEVAVPVMKKGEIVGALVGRKEADALSAITKDTVYGKNGYSYMINGAGTIIADPNLEKVLKRYNPMNELKNDKGLASLAKAFKVMLDKKSGTVNYNYNKRNMYAGFSTIEGTDWTFVITADQAEIFAYIPLLIKTILLFLFLIFLLSVVIVYHIGNKISKPLIEISRQSLKISELDITQNFLEQCTHEKNEVGTLAKTFRTLTESLRVIIHEISDSANQVALTSQELSVTAQHSSEVTKDISKTVDEIAKGAYEQAVSTEQGSEHVLLLGKLIENNQIQIENLNKTSNTVSGLVHEGLKDIEELSHVTKENEAATRKIYEVIVETKRNSELIEDACNLISDMARQTNLVALNASIEAARAGEAGKGFTVVAEEIQRMADQSAASTKYIDGIIHNLQANMNKAVECIKQIAVISSDQKKSVDQTAVKYQSIAQAMQESEKAVTELNISDKFMTESKNEILIKLQSLSSIAIQNSAGTQQASTAMEEQISTSLNVAEASDKLSVLSSNLQSIVSRFKL